MENEKSFTWLPSASLHSSEEAKLARMCLVLLPKDLSLSPSEAEADPEAKNQAQECHRYHTINTGMETESR